MFICEHENVIVIGGFNLCVKNMHVEATSENFDLCSSINKTTCEHSSSPNFIDLNQSTANLELNYSKIMRFQEENSRKIMLNIQVI